MSVADYAHGGWDRPHTECGGTAYTWNGTDGTQKCVLTAHGVCTNNVHNEYVTNCTCNVRLTAHGVWYWPTQSVVMTVHGMWYWLRTECEPTSHGVLYWLHSECGNITRSVLQTRRHMEGDTECTRSVFWHHTECVQTAHGVCTHGVCTDCTMSMGLTAHGVWYWLYIECGTDCKLSVL